MIILINIAIVEDNSIIREKICSLVNNTLFSSNSEYRVYQYESSELFLKDLNIINHHLLILDIELPGISGTELAQIMSRQNNECIIVFLTSYEHYMKDAFGINVYRYIMKNESDKILPGVLNEVMNILVNKEKRVFNVPGGLATIFLEDILYIELLERNPHLILIDKQRIKLSSTSLKSVNEHINSSDFIQINNHTIVNMRHIIEISNNNVYLDSRDKALKISRGKFQETLKMYQKHLLKGNTL